MGANCKLGPNNTLWSTDGCDTQEMAKYQQELHLKYAHAHPQPVTITVPEYYPSDTLSEPIESLELHDLDGNNVFKYVKKKREYKCRECDDQEFKSVDNFKKHLYNHHLRDVDMGKNNPIRKPYIKRNISQEELLQGKEKKFKCDNVPCKRSFCYRKDLNHHRENLCKYRNKGTGSSYLPQVLDNQTPLPGSHALSGSIINYQTPQSLAVDDEQRQSNAQDAITSNIQEGSLVSKSSTENPMTTSSLATAFEPACSQTSILGHANDLKIPGERPSSNLSEKLEVENPISGNQLFTDTPPQPHSLYPASSLACSPTAFSPVRKPFQVPNPLSPLSSTPNPNYYHDQSISSDFDRMPYDGNSLLPFKKRYASPALSQATNTTDYVTSNGSVQSPNSDLNTPQSTPLYQPAHSPRLGYNENTENVVEKSIQQDDSSQILSESWIQRGEKTKRCPLSETPQAPELTRPGRGKDLKLLQEIHQEATEDNKNSIDNEEYNYGNNSRGKNMKRLLESLGEDGAQQQGLEETLDETAPSPPPPKILNLEQPKANLKGIYLT